MSTDAFLLVQDPIEGTYKGVYLNKDGHIRSCGYLLETSYNTYEKALELILMGGISSLSSTIEDSIFYSRDWEEYKNVFEYSRFELSCLDVHDRVYLFRDGEWYFMQKEICRYTDNEYIKETLLSTYKSIKDRK